MADAAAALPSTTGGGAKTSRLDRLFQLLDTGSTAALRQAAATQIAAAARHHPLPGLLRRLLPYLRSKHWDTRSAAGATLEAIAKTTAGTWTDLTATPAAEDYVAAVSGAGTCLDAQAVAHGRTWAVLEPRFNVAAALASGPVLLAGGRNAHDAPRAAGEPDHAAQRQFLMSRLGLGSAEMAADVTASILAPEPGSTAANGTAPASAQPVPAAAATTTTATATSTRSTRPGKRAARASWVSAPSLPSSSPPPPPQPPSDPPGRSPTTPKTAAANGCGGSNNSTGGDDVASLEAALEDPALSAREKNKIKRKLKVLKKSSSSMLDMASSSTPPPTVLNAPRWVQSTPTRPAKRARTVKSIVKPDPEADMDMDMDAVESVDTSPTASASASQLPVAPPPPPPPLAAAAAAAAVPPPADETKVVISFKPKTDLDAAAASADAPASSAVASDPAHQWPFQALCDLLAHDLCDAVWEVRHGAAIGLRDLLKSQGPWAGMLANVSPHDNTLLNRRYLHHLVAHLLRVLCRDRFSDFLGDTVIVPVRESCAQALGALVKHLQPDDVAHVHSHLIQMVESTAQQPGAKAAHASGNGGTSDPWSMQLSSFLGIKYVLAVRADLTDLLFPPSLDVILRGLQHPDDDVRAIASSTLLPITGKLLSHLLNILCHCLDGCDDLSASSSSVMDLVAALAEHKQVTDVLIPQPGTNSQHLLPLAVLVPRLYKFFRHPLSCVRHAAVRTVTSFMAIERTVPPRQETWWIRHELIRHVFQNFLLEEMRNVLDATMVLWQALVAYLEPQGAIPPLFGPLFKAMFQLVFTPVGQPLDESLLLFADSAMSSPAAAVPATAARKSKQHSQGQGQGQGGLDAAMIKQDLSVVSAKDVQHGRLLAATALGQCLASWRPDFGPDAVIVELTEYLDADWAFQRQMAAITIQEFALQARTVRGPTTAAPERMVNRLRFVLDGNAHARYQELAQSLVRLYAECVTVTRETGGKVPPIDRFELAHARELAAVHAGLAASLAHHEALDALLDTRVHANLAAALISLEALPPKLNPIVRALTASLKTEENDELQQLAARAIAKLVRQCEGKQVNVKIIGNVVVLLCSDPDTTPVVAMHKETAGNMTLAILQREAEAEENVDRRRKKSGNAAGDEVVDAYGIPVAADGVNAGVIMHRGADHVLRHVCAEFADQLLTRLPVLTKLAALPVPDDAQLLANTADEAAQTLVDALQVNLTLAQYVTPGVHIFLLAQLERVSPLLAHPLAVIRHMAAKTIAAMTRAVPSGAMLHVIRVLLPKLGDATAPTARQGVAEALYHIVTQLGHEILPYIIFLVVPLMGAMSDFEDAVRRLVTNSFAALIQLVPLEEGIPDPPDFPAELVAQRQSERQFIGQLLGTSTVEPYHVPVEIKAELRKYQQDGINWMMFLNRYQLHGILCDDMGLGKTLQSITVMASHHHAVGKQRKCTSLVVCPPTLTGHWHHEILRYTTNLNPVCYAGSVPERRKLVDQLDSFSVIITSYDTLRNDIDVFAGRQFEYCVLDEGHVIRNGKTKTTKAVKQVQARHRLILSGTPIQNNVLELWSLFDFLMPGFLGTEHQFNERYARPILASRDAKKSSAAQAAGLAALESLHRQVLPFLLRRLKEDVLHDLPPKIIQDHYCDLTPLQRRLYQQVIESAELAQRQHVFQSLHAMRRIANHPLLYLQSAAGHTVPDAAKLAADPHLHGLDQAPKLQALKQLLQDCGIGVAEEPSAAAAAASVSADPIAPHRVLIFCQMRQTLDLIEHDLFRKHLPTVSYLRLDGQTDRNLRHGLVQKFNDDPSIDVLLLTTSAGGLGLNLTGADTVIFVEHDWNPMMDLQAMDRAHRLGQKRVVNVYRLITRGTLEEKIMGLQRFKLHIAGQVVNQQNAALETMDTDQVLDLFSLGGDGKASSKASKPPASAAAAAVALESLDELAQQQYDDEYNMDGYLASM
ncbi:hypothetical protein AMAG_04297 [Allomyces macrogynus ATCC 38327]|uniref:TATA-binding protein-associated factor MOT1 n=1 Tax=Allomyces macrogynus (strain ATCC 38327) TaxID=578462 RepID=A0A0L0S809_ALLM3|nr:hypothetical protein AMAG_04297 [Allomyces macrogynus ATCC 38327]|eukprot:KNE58743.1 hypothetical protein AMAG_04297 [Allomyces macrogynus ATCC 38327]